MPTLAVAPNPASVANDHFAIIVGGIVTVLVAMVPLFVLIIRTYGKTTRIRDQVENDHDTNLREEADTRHHENSSRGERLEQKIDLALQLVAGLQQGQGALQQGQSSLYQLIRGNTDRIDDIEDTIHPPGKEPPSPWTQPKPSPKPLQPGSSPASPPPEPPSQTA